MTIINAASLTVTPVVLPNTLTVIHRKAKALDEMRRLARIEDAKERQLAQKLKRANKNPSNAHLEKKFNDFRRSVEQFKLGPVSAAYKEQCEAIRAAEMATADELRQRLVALSGNVWLTGEDMRVLASGGYAVRLYEGTFGQTAAGAHSVSKWGINQHAIGGSNAALVLFNVDAAMSVDGYDYTWVKILLNKEHIKHYTEQEAVITMNSENSAYQRSLLRAC